MTDDELASTLREPHIADPERRKLADPHTGEDQQLHDRGSGSAAVDRLALQRRG